MTSQPTKLTHPASKATVETHNPEPYLSQGWVDEDAAAVAADFDPLQGGTVAATLAFVGQDLDRARQQLALEQAKDNPRSTLVEALDAVLNPPA